MKNLDSKIKHFLEIQSQFKILHWQTKGYARHIAFGNIYQIFDGLIDTYVEIYMGKHGRFQLQESTKNLNIENLGDLNMIQFIQKTKSFIISLGADLSPETDTDLLNIKDEMLAEVNKLAYLLTLE